MLWTPKVAVDVTEHPIQRPQKTGRQVLWQEKASYGQIADYCGRCRLIDDVEEVPGSVYDFKLCKETLLRVLILTVMILADSSYQGIQDYHEWSLVPIKKSKSRELSAAEKAYNTELSRRRIVIENINAQIKVFKIMSYPYRNRRRRHLLRTKLVCDIINAEKV